MKKIITTILLIVCCITSKADTWTDSGKYDASWYSDLSNSFDISTAKEFAGLAYLCNNGTSFMNKTINLQANVDLTGNEWNPISIFNGTFNGNYHKITNVRIDYHDSNFGATKGFIISNIGNIENLELQGAISLASGGYGAISAGGLCVENEGSISNCIINCTVNAYSKGTGANNGYNHNAGGICVINKGKIINCINKGDVSAKPSIYDYNAIINCAGGIAAQNSGEITNCMNYGNIFTSVGYDSSSWQSGWGLPYGYSGGISGDNTGKINNAISIGNIEAKVVRLGNMDGFNAYGGGIVASNSGTIENVYYSSSNTIEAPHIVNNGLKLSSSQINNSSYEFTTLLNQNVLILQNNEICFWANTPLKNSNIPFHLNKFALTTQVVNADQNNATFKANPINISSSAIISKGFEYKKVSNLTYKKVSASSDFLVSVADLELSAAYIVRAFVTTTGGNTIYFNEINFSTSPIYVETKEATNITAISAVLNGYVQSGSIAIKSQGFLWKVENEAKYHILYTEGQEYQYKLEELSPSTMYYYQAFALTENGDNLYGETMSFRTQPVAITFNQGTIIDHNRIDLKGNININFATDVTIEYKKVTDSNYSKTTVRSNDDGSFECGLSELLPNTEYDCRAYIIHNGTYIYSQVYTYKTLNVQVQTLTPLLSTSVTFRGEVIGGSNIGTVGFEYRDANFPDLITSDFIYSKLENTSFTAQTNNVVNGNEYKYRAFYQDENGNKTHGEWVLFTPNNIISGINNVVTGDENTCIITGYYNVQGKRFDTPQKGINIIRYSDGSTHKMIVK